MKSVRWTRLALRDLRHQLAYVAGYDREASIRLSYRVGDASKLLTEHPEAGRVGKAAGTRELVVSGTQYIIVYRVERTRVMILRLIHSAQQWPPAG